MLKLLIGLLHETISKPIQLFRICLCCFALIRRRERGTFNELIIDTHNSLSSGGIFLCKVCIRQSQSVQLADVKFKGV